MKKPPPTILDLRLKKYRKVNNAFLLFRTAFSINNNEPSQRLQKDLRYWLNFLPQPEQTAVRLRYGNNLIPWWKTSGETSLSKILENLKPPFKPKLPNRNFRLR
jgi:hypothetical protein